MISDTSQLEYQTTLNFALEAKFYLCRYQLLTHISLANDNFVLFCYRMAFPFNYPDPSIQLVVMSVTSGFNGGDDPEDLVEAVVVVKDVKDDTPLSVEQ